MAPPDIAWPPPFETADETYIVCPESDARAIIRDGELTIDVLEQRRGALERWRRSFSARFPLCQRDVRESLRQFPVVPPALYRPEYDAFQFATEVAGCTDGLRVAGARCLRRTLPVEGCVVERTVISIAGVTMQSMAVTGPDERNVERLVRRLQFDRVVAGNIVSVVKDRLGVRASAVV